MKKRIFSLLLCLALILSAVPTSVGAADGAGFHIHDTSTYEGNWLSVPLYAENLENLASLELEVYYDSDKLSMQYASEAELIYNNDVLLSVNTDISGVIKVSIASLSGISGSGTLLWLQFMAKEDVAPCTTDLTVSVGEAYDTSLDPVSASGGTGTVTIQKQQALGQFYLHGQLSETTLRQGSIVTLYVYNNYGYELSGCLLEVGYDSTLFELESAEAGDSMSYNGGICSVNTENPGTVRMAYASTYSNYPYELLTIRLKVTANVTTQTAITYSISDAYNASRQAYGKYSSSISVSLEESNYTAGKSLSLRSDPMVVGEESTSILQLEGDNGVAAADFTISYDKNVLECVKVEKVADLDFLVINPNYKDGLIKFSYINQKPGTEDLDLIKITWKPKASPMSHYLITPGGTGVVDSEYEAVELIYTADSDCIHAATYTNPPCTEQGYTTYTCAACGDTYNDDFVEATGHDLEFQAGREATCQREGYKDHWNCTVCGKDFSDSTGSAELTDAIIPKTPHSYGEPSFTWADNYSTCTMTLPCNSNEPHEVVKECVVTYSTSGASCTVPGDTTYTAKATVDGRTYQGTKVVTGQPLGHDLDHVEAVEGNCVSMGNVEYWVCVRCLMYYTDEKAEHMVDYNDLFSYGDTHVGDLEPIDYTPTCVDEGLEGGSWCTACGEMVDEGTIVPALGHNYASEFHWDPSYESVSVLLRCTECINYYEEPEYVDGYQVWLSPESITTDSKAATCGEAGYNRYTAVVTYNGKEYSETQTVALSATGHSFTQYTSNGDATSDADGTKTAYCDYGCGTSNTITDVGSALGHSYLNYVSDQNATCTEDGTMTAYCECGCGRTDTVTELNSALGHSFTSYSSDGNATCMADGTMTAYCDRNCGNKSTLPEPGSKKPHDYQNYDIDTYPTCTEVGYEKSICASCSNSVNYREIPALDHDFQIYDMVVSPTCYSTGREISHCSRCPETDERELPVVDHSYEFWEYQAPTCIENEVWTYGCQYGCGSSYSEEKIGSSIGHMYITGEIHWSDDYSSAYYLAHCGSCEMYYDDPESVEGYCYRNECTITRIRTESDCTTWGTIELIATAIGPYGETYESNYVSMMEPLGHNYDSGSVTTEPTCTLDGVRTYACKECGSTTTEEIPSPGHDWESDYTIDKPATETTDGLKSIHCKRCDAKKNVLVIPATDPSHTHSYSKKITDPTCNTQGYTTYTCSCGASYKSDYTAMLSHDYDSGSVTTAATCTKAGVKTYTCKVCGATKTESIKATGHTEVTDKAVAATCTKTGLTEGKHCSVCGTTIKKQETVKALGHKWDEGKVTKTPTAEKAGEKTFTCTVCKTTKTEEIPALGVCDGKDDCPLQKFTDVNSSHWAHLGMDFAVNNGLMNGTGTGTTFEPNTNMSRAMLVTVLWRYSGSPEAPDCNFTDVKSTDWFYKAVAWAASEGVVTGTGDGSTFAPNDNVTREMMATILYRYAKMTGVDVSASKSISNYPDANKVASWSSDAVKWAVAEGIISGAVKEGVTVLAPQDSANRAVVATIMMRFIQNVVEG